MQRLCCGMLAGLGLVLVRPGAPEATAGLPQLSSNRGASGREFVFDGRAGPLVEIPLELSLGERLDLAVRSRGEQENSVHMLLLREGRLALRSTGSLSVRGLEAGKYLLVLVAGDAGPTTVDLLWGSRVWRSGLAVGAWNLKVPKLHVGDSIESVLMPQGGGPEHVLYVISGHEVLARQEGNGTAGGVRWTSPRALSEVTLLVGTSQRFGPLRIVRNDSVDSDGDGLGDKLEAELGTCPRLGASSSVVCSDAVDARDTDGDGISDGWEVLGRGDMLPHQPLAAWGADPLHKDLFIEVDFMLRAPGETPLKLAPEVARGFAKFYEDRVGDVGPLLQLYHAASLRNPDLRTGINVHLDTGVPAENLDEATLYGDWGGYTAVPPVKNASDEWVGADYTTAWKINMRPVRRGIFRYALPYATGGGSVPINSFAFAFGIGSAWLGAHELGHGMGLGHSGPPGATGVVDVNCKPNYPSLMNYAYNDGFVGFSDGFGAPALNNASLKESHAILAARGRNRFQAALVGTFAGAWPQRV